MATSRRSHCGTRRPLTPRRSNCFKTKRCPRDPVLNRRRIPGLPVRRHHRGSAYSNLGGNRLTKPQSYHSASLSALRPKALPEKRLRAGSFASSKESLKGNLGILIEFTGVDFQVIVTATDIGGSTAVYEMRVPVLDVTGCVPPDFDLVKPWKEKTTLLHDFWNFDGENSIKEAHQKWGESTIVCGNETYTLRARSSTGSSNGAEYRQLRHALDNFHPSFDELSTLGDMVQSSGRTYNFDANTGIGSPPASEVLENDHRAKQLGLSKGAVNSRIISREPSKYEIPDSSEWSTDTNLRTSQAPSTILNSRYHAIQGLTGNDRQHLQRDVDLGLARNVYDCAGEPVIISGRLTVPSHKSACSSAPRSSGRKRVNEDSNTGNDSEDDEFGKANKRQNTGGTTESPTAKFFSCPYFKKDPVRHLKCFMRFKLKRVKDVKQHLYRKHSLSEHCCPSCWATFDCRSDWDDHIRNRSCQAKEMPEKYGDFMTVDQKKAISRRTDSGLDEHEQWYNVWGVLFPGEVRPASPYLKSRELEELIPIVRWFWEKNSSAIVPNIISSSWTATVPQPTNTLPTEDGRVTKVDEEARRLTHTMDILLNRVEESIQSSGRRVSSPTQSSIFTPSPLLSDTGILKSVEDGLTPSFVPKIEVNEPQDDQSATQHPTVGGPPGLPDTDFWIQNVMLGLSSTEFLSCEYTESFKPE